MAVHVADEVGFTDFMYYIQPTKIGFNLMFLLQTVIYEPKKELENKAAWNISL